MVKRKLKKLLALALSILMLSSSVTGLFPTAAAVEPDAVTPLADPADTSSAGGDPLAFDDPDNGRPNLFVDFLGDNYSFQPTRAATPQAPTLIAPAGFDQSKDTNPNAAGETAAYDDDNPGNQWQRYGTEHIKDGTIFWVGVGIDRREIFELLKGGKGLTGIETGFYYDNRYIEPYIDPKYTGDDAYLKTIHDANINNLNYPKNTQWSSDYEILRAETAMKPKTDLITQEELAAPTINEILTNSDGGDWKMTYVSLELKDYTTTTRRLQDGYVGVDNLPEDADGNPQAPAAAHGTGRQGGKTEEDSDYQYLLLIPFKLKAYGDPNHLALRLLRNATHFSIGGGSEGTQPYGAWEKVTTRNPGKDIKLLTRFTGDLNIFGGGKTPDVDYSAKLIIKNYGGPGNKAKLSVDGDPAVWPVYADTDQDIIGGLRSGLGMKLETSAMSGYTITVTVRYYQKSDEGTPTLVIHNYTTVVNQKEYTFVMPTFAPTSRPLEVEVVFEPNNVSDFSVYLSELQQTDGTFDTAQKVGNETTITTNVDVNGDATSISNTISTFSPAAAEHPNHPAASGLYPHHVGPACTGTKTQPLRIDVSTHADYEAVVRIFDFSSGSFVIPSAVDTGGRNDEKVDSVVTSPTFGQIVLPYGGTITLPMPASDVDVEVVYRKAQQYDVTLEVFHNIPGDVTDMNTAQLVHLVYDDENVPSRAYSGQVYENKDIPDTDLVTRYSLPRHRALKDPSKRIPWITKAESALSLSLGGDTETDGSSRKGSVWNPNELPANKQVALGANTVMARLSAAAAEVNFQGVLSALDLNSQTVTATKKGLRKDLQGNTYGEEDVASMEAILWELRQRVMNNAALRTAYDKTVTTPGGTTAYNYLDLTPAQVQAYVLGVLEASEAYRKGNLQYRESLKKYQAAKMVYDTLKDMPALVGLPAPVEPEKPLETKVDATTFVRTYQGEDYLDIPGATSAENGYLYDYNAYIGAYQTFIDGVKDSGRLPTPLPALTAPAAKAVKAVPVLSDAAAAAKVDAFSWKPSDIKTGSEAHTIQTRRDRTVWVAMEADSAYTYENVEIYAKDPTTGEAGIRLAVITPPAVNDTTSGYRNVVSFTMPNQPCVVRVNYVKRATRDIRVQIVGADGEEDNLASVEAYRVADHGNLNHPLETAPQAVPVLDQITNEGNQAITPYPAAPTLPTDPDPRFIYNVFENSTATIRVKKAAGYRVKVSVTNAATGTDIPTNAAVTAADPADGEIITFSVPANNTGGIGQINVSIVYEKDADPHDAFITYDPNGANDASADWHVTDPGTGNVSLVDVIRNVSEGTNLLADIKVPAGAYIRGVVVRGASGNYPYTLSGNGYNGGYGTTLNGGEHIWVDMPDEDLYVHVIFEVGLPPVEPENTLTLTVKDDENGGSDLDKVDPLTAAPNWAEATVYDEAFDLHDPGATIPGIQSTLGKVGKNVNYGNKKLTDWKFVETGKWVVVKFQAAEGYYVHKVTVGPSHLGVTVVWEDTDTISFYMPAGSTGVNVEFRKGRPTPHILTVRETWMNTQFENVTDDSRKGNFVTTASSGTILGWNQGNPVTLVEATNPERVPALGKGTGAAVPGEEVTLRFNVDEDNWYVQSVVILSDGAAYRGDFKPVDPAETVTANGKTYRVYEVKFRQPTGNVEVTVHYRQGKRPAIDDYAFTAILYDDDNQGPAYADNRLDISITGTTGNTHADVHLGRVNPDHPDFASGGGREMNAVRHPHAGDTIKLKTTLQDGYSVDYLVIDPASLNLYPVWQASVLDPGTGAVTTEASFTMPAKGVAVIARYIKGEPQQYTANLILRPPQKPDGSYYPMSQVGKGTFADPTAGNLDNYPQNAIFSTIQSTGTKIDYDLYAFDGFYIDHVSIDPAVGATGSLSGSFGYQNGDFVMPGANVNVNVWFKKGWPDEVKYDLTLEVFDSAYSASNPDNNYAAFRQVRRPNGDVAALDDTHVYGQQSNYLEDAAFDRDTVFVDIHAKADYYTNAQNILLTDTGGNIIPWWYVPGGIAFTMPPRSTTVRVTFLPIPADCPQYTATLVVHDKDASDTVKLETAAVQASPKAVTNNDVIRGLYAGDSLTLSAQPGAGRHISAVYAVVVSGAHTGDIVPLYDPSGALAHFVPGDPAAAAATQGGFAMPEGNVEVHVKFASGAIAATDKPVTLIVSGPAGSGSAAAAVEDGKPDGLMNVSATDVDTRFTTHNKEVEVTFEPDKANGYLISKLEVYDQNGVAVPYEWISMLQDPIPSTDTNTWPPPPNYPGAGAGGPISYPGFTQNAKQQIKLKVPLDGVTIHVTYAKADMSKTYRAQVVINDEMYPANATVPSRNNAWLRTAANDVQAKRQDVTPGEWVNLDLLVHPGYRIEYIVVIPQSFGIEPAMPLGPCYDQISGFTMPEGDVTVYVKFITDPTPRNNATLIVNGAPTNNAKNFGTISSPISGESPKVYVGGASQSVQARPVMDWITVNYQWDTATSSIDSITVRTTAGVDVPFTQNAVDLTAGTGQIILPMAAQDVIVTITYRNDPAPREYDVILHVLDHTAAQTLTDTQAWAKLDCAVGAPTTTNQAAPAPNPGNSVTLRVPAGQSVDVSAWMDAALMAAPDSLKLESAYVLYQSGGQMINLNLPNNSAAYPVTDSFITHPGQNDVYVAFTDRDLPQNPHTAILMLKAPEDNAGSAGIAAGGAYGSAAAYDQDSLNQANHGYASVVAGEGDEVHINVIPASGYIIDRIVVTPLGFPLETAPVYNFTRNGNSYSFDMPHCNIAVTVYLKRGTDSNARVVLHYVQEHTLDPSKPASQVADYAKLSWKPEGEAVRSIWADDNPNAPAGTTGADDRDWPNVSNMLVQVGAEVTLSATLDSNPATGKSDAILAAYVLWDGALVPLTPKHPADRNANTGLEGVEENASMTDNALADGVATFIMPDTNKDVDVFLVTTADPPPEDWHTIVVVATDTSPSGNDLGKNWGYLKQEDEPDSVWDTEAHRKAQSYGHMMKKPPEPDDTVPAHAFISLPQYKADGSPNYYNVVADPGMGYEFKPLKSGLTKNTPAYSETLIPITTSPYAYREPVGDSNRVVHLVFESSEALKLTVVIEDPDNPGNGTVTNAVDTATTGVDPLHLTSVSALGSYQIMSGVTAAAPVNIVVEPQKAPDGSPLYTAAAVYRTIDGVDHHITLTPTTDGSGKLTGSFDMPANDTTLTVTFFKPYKGTLVLKDLSSDPTHKAKMTESTETPPDTVNVSAIANEGTLENLRNTTKLTAQMVDFDKTNPKEKVTGLLTVNGATTILTPHQSTSTSADPDEYRHTIDRADATITLVVTDKNPTDPERDPYIAAVRTVNKPAGAANPTIVNTDDNGAAHDDGRTWTAAQETHKIQVHVPVPAGYEVDITAVRTDTNGNVLPTTPPITLAADGDADFTMPAANVQVTVTYRKVEFDLTLRIVDTSGETNTTTVDPAAVMSGDDPLTLNGHTAVVAKDIKVDVSAVTGSTAMIRSITVQPAGRPVQRLVNSPMPLGDDFTTGSFIMPPADTVVTVVYDKDRPGTPDGPDPYYIAYSAVDDPTYDPGNKVVSIRNITRSVLSDGTGAPLPAASPDWTAGYARDSVTVSYETAPGYYVTAKAVRHSNNATIPVVLLDHGTGGTATASFPNTPSSDITITITYVKGEQPEKPAQDVALQLIGHKQQLGNKAETNGRTLSGLGLNGTNTSHAPGYTDNVVSDDPVEITRSAAQTGDDLRTLANWATGYQVIRMTVAVRHTDPTSGAVTETGEVDLLPSKYSGSVTTRTTMPSVGDDEIAVIRVYYGNIFDATLHIIPDAANGEDVQGNQTRATDSRPNPVSSTGSLPIKATGERLIGFAGDGTEKVHTTAIPNAANNQRLVGVVWESPSTGAASAGPQQPNATDSRLSDNGVYDFRMPADNVDFYAIYETEPEDPKDKSYIAKVNFTGDSAHLGNPGNAVTITNTTDPAAAHGSYWTAAKGGQAVVVNVKVADGYKAEITTAKVDDSTKVPAGHLWADDFHYYVSRTAFVPNLTAGKDASFLMPADTDATVTIRFVKGYDLSLEVRDVSGYATPATPNKADVTVQGYTDHLTGTTTADTTPATPPTYTPNDPAHTKNGLPTHKNVPQAATVDTAITKADLGTRVRIQRNHLFSGTVTVPEVTPNTTPSTWPSYPMPAEDVVESVLFYEDEKTLFANVALKGHSDINGNTAKPIIDVDPGTNTPTGRATGSVWTATVENNKIDLTLTVAKGYLAKIKVRWDNGNYWAHQTDETQWDWLDANEFTFNTGDSTVYAPGVDEVQMGFSEGTGPFGANISDPQHFTFKMPDHSLDHTQPGSTFDPTDVTVIVEFVFAGNIPQPFHPDDPAMTHIDLDRGFIYGENRGDFALMDIPTLYQDSDKKLYDTDNYTDYPDRTQTRPTLDVKKNVKFNFFLYDAAKDEYTPLVTGTDVLLEPEDEDTLLQPTDPYNYYPYETNLANANNVLDDDPTGTNAKQPYTGSRFKLVPTEPDQNTGKRTAGAQALYDMLNNKRLGSLEEYKDGADTKYRTRLYVLAEDAIGQKSAYTQVWIRPHFTVEVSVISYAPNHRTTASLYHLMTKEELAVAAGYKDAAGNLTGDPNVSDPGEPNAMDIAHYRWDSQTKPFAQNETDYDGDVIPTSKYHQTVFVKSSELLGRFTKDYDPGAKTLLSNLEPGYDPTYALTLEKTSCLTYTRVKLELSPDASSDFDLTTDPIGVPGYYDDATLTYSISDIIYLITGDVDGNRYTKWQDYDLVYTMALRNTFWDNTVTEKPTDPTASDYAAKLKKWQISTYNPDSIAYRCDLNGDRVLSMLDVQLVQTLFDFNRSEESYYWIDRADPTEKTRVLPFGFGSRNENDYAALFALRSDGEPIPVEPDEYWSQLVDPETTAAPPLDVPYVDGDGTLWSSPLTWEDDLNAAPERPSFNWDDGGDSVVVELPGGEDAADFPVFDLAPPEKHPGGDWEAGLPAFEPDLFADLPADIIIEE